jgi:voltage-gated sodium channel
MDRLKAFVESRRFDTTIMVLIIVNAVTLGMETVPAVMERIGPALLAFDRAVLGVFVVELLLRMVVYRSAFFRDPWRIFDLVIVSISLMPATGSLSVLRALRVLRVLRLVSIVPSLRKVVGGLIAALPGMGSITLLLGLVFYVSAVMATKLYSATFPDLFGSIPASSYTLFQIMTLEGWSGEIVRPVMEVHPYAWAFFIPFILATTFTVLNLFIGIVVNAMQAEHEAQSDAKADAEAADIASLLAEVRALRGEIAALKAKA